MKNLLAIILLTATSLSANSQQYGWKDLSANIPQTGQYQPNLTDVFFITEDEGWITTDTYNEIYHTSDGGETFDIQTTQYECYTIHMLDANIGYAGGKNGRVYYTSDGGENWNAIGTIGVSLTDISFPPNTNPEDPIGYACGDAGNVWEITNTLTNLNSPSYSTFRGISAPSINNVYSCGGGRIYYYDGSGFTSMSTPGGTFNDIHFANENDGFVVGTGGVLGKTIDGGSSWITLANPDLLNRSLIGVFFLDAYAGWVVGDYGLILHTIDGETLLIEADGLTDQHLARVHFTSPINGYIVGNKRTLLKYTEISGIEEKMRNQVFEIYPNPCKDQLSLRYSSFDIRHSVLKITDLTGKVVHAAELSGNGENKFTIDVSHLPPGMYLVQLQFEHQTATRKLIIQH